MMTKRSWISSVLILFILFGMLPASSAHAAESYPNTYSNTGDLRKDIIGVAATQIGYKEGAGNDTKYGDWYGLPNNPWCAMFVSWCADQANVPTTILKKSAKASPLASYFDLSYHDGASYTPKPGDLFFTKSFNHVGLVYTVSGEYFYSIEGNSNGGGSADGDGVVSNRRRISGLYFASPEYEKDRAVTLDFNINGGSVVNGGLTYDRYQVLSSDGINMRSGPGTSYDKLIALPKGVAFTVTESRAAGDYTWGKTTYGGQNGWCVISEDWTKKIGTVSAVPYTADAVGLICNSGSGAKLTYRMIAGAAATALPDASTLGICRNGYTFAGWSTAAHEGDFFQKGKSYTAEQIAPEVAEKNLSLSLYAVWMPASVQVSYHANGAYIRSETYRIDEDLLYKTSAAEPYRQKWSAGEYKTNGLVNGASFGLYKPGYTFKGWSSLPGGGKLLDQDAAMSTEAFYAKYAGGKTAVTLYAVWEVNTVMVQYHANGGVLNSSTYQSKTNGIYKENSVYQQKWTYNEPRPTGLVNDTSFGLSRSGYRFIGWSTTASGGVILNMDDLALLPTDFAAAIKEKSLAVTLYARWVSASHNHSFAGYRYNHDATSAKDGTETATCSCGATDIRTKSGSKLLNSAALFHDVAVGAWYCHSMDYAATFSLLKGNDRGGVMPQKNMTRAEFTQLLANLSGVELQGAAQSSFADVEPSAWYASAVEWAFANGIVSGTAADRFSPDGLITREQICAMLSRYKKWTQGSAFSHSADPDHFTDEEQISAWAKDAVYGCKEAEIVSGTSENEFSPKRSATRAEAAAMIARYHAAYDEY